MAEIDKNFMSTYAKVATHDGDDEPIQIWAKDAEAYGGIGSDKLGIWGSVVAVDFDISRASISWSVDHRTSNQSGSGHSSF